MSNYQFIASLVSSLAWPLALVVSAFLFRRKLMELLPKLRMKYGEIDVSFRLEQAEQDARALPSNAQKSPVRTPTIEEKSRFDRLLELSPRAALLEARADLEEVIQRIGSAAGLDDGTFSMLQITRYLREHGLISSAVSALSDHLRALGNAAAHNARDEITKDDAIRYRGLVNLLISNLQLRRARDKDNCRRTAA